MGYFAQNVSETAQFIQGLAITLKLSDPRPLHLVELGCGGGDIALRIAAHVERYTGIEASQSSLERSRDEVYSLPKHLARKLEFRRSDLMDEPSLRAAAAAYSNHRLMIACVGNTVASIAREDRTMFLRTVAQCAGVGGIVVVGTWHPRSFGDAVQHFHSPNTEIEGVTIDYRAATLKTRGGCETEWASIDCLEESFRKADIEQITRREATRGILWALRPSQQPPGDG